MQAISAKWNTHLILEHKCEIERDMTCKNRV